MRQHTHTIDDVHIHCRHLGPDESPAIVCLHGLMDTGASFLPLIDHLMPRLADDWRWLAPDWRGHGDSQWTPGAYVFSQYLADLDCLLEQLVPAGPVVLVAHSMGGQAASLYAGARPERVAGLVLLDTLNVPDSDPAKAPGRYREWLATRRTPPAPRRYGDRAAFIERLARRYPELNEASRTALADLWLRPDGENGWRLAADPAHFKSSPYGFRADEAIAVWQEITAPVLMIDGGASPAKWFIDDETRRARRAALADCRHVELDRLGHMLHWQAPARVADAMIHFIDRCHPGDPVAGR